MSRTNKWQPENERPRKLKPERKKKSSVKRMKYMDFEEDDEENIT
jgi:hypothetical protein